MVETDQQNPKIVTYSKKKIAAIAISVLIIALAAALTCGLLITGKNPSSSQTGNQNTSQSWIAVGAYALETELFCFAINR
jgi:flagellar basal body-associated protein FliL